MDTDRFVRSIGKQIFIEYYYEFKSLNSQDMINLLIANNVSNDAGANWRTNNAAKIFDNKLQCEALEIIINSKRVSSETIKRAKEILNDECT